MRAIAIACILMLSLSTALSCREAEPPKPPAGPLESLIQRMVAGEWDAYGEIAVPSGETNAPWCELEGYPQGISTGYCWPTRAFPKLQSIPEDGVCTFYMLATGTPVRAVLSTDWLAEELGVSREEVMAEIEVLAAENPALNDAEQKLPKILYDETAVIVGHTFYDITDGPVTAFEYRGAAIELYDIEIPSITDLELLYIEIDADTAQMLLEQDVKYPKYLSRGAKNKLAALDKLVQLLATKGAAGILRQYDFRGFELAVDAPPPDYRYHAGDDWQQLIYTLGSYDEVDEFQCDLSITDDDAFTNFRFSGDWYCTANQTTPDALNEEFDALFAAYSGGRWEVDSPSDELDSALQSLTIEDVLLTRKVYLNLNDGDPVAFFSLALPGEKMLFSPELLNTTDWHSAEHLPAASDDAGELELLIRDVVTTPTHQIAARLGLVLRDIEGLPAMYACFPYSVMMSYDLGDESGEAVSNDDNPPSFYLSSYDDLYTWTMRFNPAWFQQIYNLRAEELSAQFDSLYETYAGTEEESGLSDWPYILREFEYGSVGVQQMTTTDNGSVLYVDYYILPPSWNTLAWEAREAKRAEQLDDSEAAPSLAP